MSEDISTKLVVEANLHANELAELLEGAASEIDLLRDEKADLAAKVETLTAANEELTALVATLREDCRHTEEHAREKIEELTREREKLDTALGKLAPKGAWICTVLEDIWHSSTTEEAVAVAAKARPSIEDCGLWNPKSRLSTEYRRAIEDAEKGAENEGYRFTATKIRQLSPKADTCEVEVDRSKIRDAIADSLGEAYDCIRVWSAWGYGTMGPDDFVLVAEDDSRLDEITDAVIAAISPKEAE